MVKHILEDLLVLIIDLSAAVDVGQRIVFELFVTRDNAIEDGHVFLIDLVVAVCISSYHEGSFDLGAFLVVIVGDKYGARRYYNDDHCSYCCDLNHH